jgi:Mrp family chromosome partitioning ATPase
LKQRYGYIVIVAPPVRDDVSALRLAQVVDHVAVVVVAEKTRRPVLTDMLRDLDQMGAHLLGLVMLGRRTHIPQAVYRLIS